MDGIKNSLNVAVAFGIAVYQLRGQLKSRFNNEIFD
jgi:tRNA G18 (ribose-2'-O)-methylase SpoU